MAQSSTDATAAAASPRPVVSEEQLRKAEAYVEAG